MDRKVRRIMYFPDAFHHVGIFRCSSSLILGRSGPNDEICLLTTMGPFGGLPLGLAPDAPRRSPRVKTKPPLK